MMIALMRRLPIIALVVMLPLGSASKCGGNVDRSGHNPTDRKVDPRRAMIANIYAHATVAPYEVIVDIYGGVGGHESSHETITTTRGAYTQRLQYTSGRRLAIRVEVKPSRYPGRALCSITDDSRIEKIGPTDGWRAICELTTSR